MMVSAKRGDWELGAGSQPPPFAKQMIRTVFLCCKHGDEHGLFTVSMDGFNKARGWGARSPGHLQHK